MAAATTATASAKTSTQLLFEQVGLALPDRQRIKATKATVVNIEPTGSLKLTAYIDTYVTGKVDKSKNNLEGKKLVLFFGSESHPLTRTFYTPKMAMLYQNLTSNRDDVEFLYVSLDQTKVEYDRFTKSHPWPCIPWEDEATRATLTQFYHERLKKQYGMCSVVVLDTNQTSILNMDAEPNIASTQNETGSDFPWVTSQAANCCAGTAALVFCTIL